MIIVNNMSILRSVGQSLHAKPAPKATIYSYPAVDAVYISKEASETLLTKPSNYTAGALSGNCVKMPNGTVATVITDVVIEDDVSNSSNMVGRWFVPDTSAKLSIEEQAKEQAKNYETQAVPDFRVIALYFDRTDPDPAKHKVVIRAFGSSGELGIESRERFAVPITIDGEQRNQLTRRQFKKFARGLKDGTVKEPTGGMFVPDMSYAEMARNDPYSPQNLALKLTPVVLIGGTAAEVVLIDGKGIANWATHRAGPWISENAHRLGAAVANMPPTTAVAIGTVITAGALLAASALLRRSPRSSYDKELSPTGVTGAT